MYDANPDTAVDAVQPISLQSRLDAIARERAVLALARQLAAQGLLEGAELRRTEPSPSAIESSGLLEIERDRSPPQAVVRLGDGRAVPFSLEGWTAR